MKTILHTTPETLLEDQYNFAKQKALEILKEVSYLLERDCLAEIINRLNISPSGDGHGCENHYIDFSDIHPELDDIHSVVQRLIILKEKIRKQPTSSDRWATIS